VLIDAASSTTGYAGMTRYCIHLRLAAASAACAAAVAVPGLAQITSQNFAPSDVSSTASETGDLAEITVTAQRRAENQQNVPMSMVAFGEERLKTMALSSITDLGQATPGLIAADEFGYFQPHLRGVGTTAGSASVENPVAVYVDGIYYGAQAGSILLLTEGIDRVEVDRGPQGTLFGRNATAGLIQIITKDPDPKFRSTVNLTTGNYNTFGVSMYLTGAVTPHVSSNVSLNFQDQGRGYGRNYFTGLEVNKTHDLVIRQKNLITVSPRDRLLLAFDYAQDHSSSVLIPAPGTTPLGGTP
jgi:iron complex outermembrane receptor protein